jgi:hypothetical protein
MMHVLLKALGTGKDFDFLQALLNNFLKSHNDAIIEDEDLTETLMEIHDRVANKFAKMEELIQGNLCMAQYFAGINNF